MRMRLALAVPPLLLVAASILLVAASMLLVAASMLLVAASMAVPTMVHRISGALEVEVTKLHPWGIYRQGRPSMW